MIIRGRERFFELNVQSHEELAAICPNGDLSSLGELFGEDTGRKNIEVDIQIACILNKGYEDRMEFEDPEYKAVYLTADDCRFLSIAEIRQMESEISQAISSGSKVTVIGETPKSSGKNVEGEKAEASV